VVERVVSPPLGPFLCAPLLAALACVTPAVVVAAPQPVRIGVVLDGPAVRAEPAAARFRDEIKGLLRGEFEVFDTYETADWTAEGVRAAFDRLLDDPRIDLVIAGGFLASVEACWRESLPKPVVAPFVLDARIQGCPIEDGRSGRSNLVYATFPSTLAVDLAVFRQMVPFTRLALIRAATHVDAPLVTEGLRRAGRELGVEITVVVAGDDAATTLAALPKDVDAVYVAPLLRFADREMRTLADGLIERRLPAFSAFGPEDVELGLLATNAPSADIPRLARRTALNVQRILLGEPAASLPVTFSRGEELTVNMATARALGVYPPWSQLIDARLLNEERTEVSRSLDLETAVGEALRANLDLQAAERAVLGGAQEVRRARAALLPQLEVASRARFVDADRASSSFGTQRQRELSASLDLRQVLYSDEAWAGLEIQERLQEALERRRDQVRLDVALEAASAYLDVLRAKTKERIARDNLRLTRENLERARVRTEIGAASPAELYRWQSQESGDRRSVIAAVSTRNGTEIQLNRILDRPGEEPFSTRETGMEDDSLLASREMLRDYVGNPWTFRIFRDFNVAEALRNAPELAEADAQIRAQQRSLTAARRAFWMPELGLQASVGRRLAEGGAGSPLDLGVPIPRRDRNDWQVGLQASLPLFAGGERIARRTQAEEDLDRLRVERAATARRVEERARTALHDMGASYAAIGLTRQGAEAARRNLDLVADAYGRGAVSIIDLLDAQNAAFVAEEAAGNAVHDFLLDLMRVERAAGSFTLFTPPPERQAYLDRLRLFREAADRAARAEAR
jgi:outer membrane protein TolC/ABC-type uncharacterized transport system substrate-binding protein